MIKPESFVVEEINRLEHDWMIEDEIIDWQLDQGRVGGEYYGQTGNEHHGARGADITYNIGVTTTVAQPPGRRGGPIFLGSYLTNLRIYGPLISDGSDARMATLTLTVAADDGAVTFPPLALPEGQLGVPTDFTPFDADGNFHIPDGFVDIGCMAEDGLTMRADICLPGDPAPSEDLRMEHLDLTGPTEVATPTATTRQVDLTDD